MKKFIAFFLLIPIFALAQMPNISSVWMNNSKPYIGTISSDKMVLKLRITTADQDKKNDQEYFVSGFTLVDKTNTQFEGKLIITKYKPGAKRSTVFGEYKFVEEGKGQHSGILKGKFIYTFMWNKKTEKIDQQLIKFVGNWKSYDGVLSYPTSWSNQ